MEPSTTDRFSVAALWGSLWAHFFDMDHGLLGKLVALLARPGETIRAALATPTNVYTQPLRIFLLANVFFFLVGPSVGLLNFSLDSLGQIPFYSQAATDQAGRLGLEFPLYRERFDTSYRLRQPTFLVLLTFPLAAVSFLLHRRLSFGHHYVVALLLLAWLLVALPVAQLVTSLFVRLIDGSLIWGILQLSLLASGVVWATYRATRVGLGSNGIRSVLVTASLTVAIVLLLAAYGHLVFWITFGMLEVGA